MAKVTYDKEIMWQRQHKSSARRLAGRKSQFNYRG
jgi:hypothetical protein